MEEVVDRLNDVLRVAGGKLWVERDADESAAHAVRDWQVDDHAVGQAAAERRRVEGDEVEGRADPSGSKETQASIPLVLGGDGEVEEVPVRPRFRRHAWQADPAGELEGRQRADVERSEPGAGRLQIIQPLELSFQEG